MKLLGGLLLLKHEVGVTHPLLLVGGVLLQRTPHSEQTIGEYALFCGGALSVLKPDRVSSEPLEVDHQLFR